MYFGLNDELSVLGSREELLLIETCLRLVGSNWTNLDVMWKLEDLTEHRG